tara:strand:- start:1805 stop:2224 length:420 start_codon:yes stop_codon:yes gene_type:complete
VSRSLKYIFKNYAEYFRITRPLNLFQRKRIFGDLSPSERDFLESDFDKNGWEDLLIKNEINRRSDSIKKKYNRDLFLIKIKLLSKKKIKVKKSFWNHVVNTFSDMPNEYLNQTIGGIVSYVDEEDSANVILQLDKGQHN